LVVWNKTVIGNIFDKVKTAESALHMAELALDSAHSEHNKQAYKCAFSNYQKTLDQE
jgi:hypothetical protein